MPLVVHSTFQGTELHEDKRIKVPVRAASTANVSLAAPGATIDGVTLAANDRVLLKNQATTSQNGIYVWTGAATALVRATDANTATLFFFGFIVYVREGTANAGTFWAYSQPAAVTLETTAITFIPVGSTSTFTGEVVATDFSATGLTGATAGARFVGATASGAPTTGTFAVGDLVEDRAAGGLWACTVAGTPGTWLRTGFANPLTTVGDLMVGTLVGGTAGTPGRLAAGATVGNVLTTNGVGVLPSWQAPTGGGGGPGLASNGVVPIQTIGPLSAAQASVSFAVPAGYRNLRLVWQARGDTAATSTNMQLQFNGDTGANYDRELLFNNTSTTAANSEALAATSMVVGIAAANTAPAGATGSGFLVIPNYSSTTFRKQIQGLSGFKSSDTAGFGNDVWVGEWRSTAAVTSIVLALAAGNFATGSFFQLWGELDSAPTLPASQSNLIQEVVLGTAASSITLSGIPQTYRDLRVEMSVRSDAAAVAFVNMTLQLNGDFSTGAYDWVRNEALTTGTPGTFGLGSDTSISVGRIVAATGSTNSFSPVTIKTPDYTNSSKNHSVLFDVGTPSTTAANMFRAYGTGEWRSTVPLTSLVFALAAGNFIAGTVVRLYGEPSTALPKIAETVLAAPAATVTFSAIPQTYRQLHLVAQVRGSGSTTNTRFLLQLNGDTTAADYESEHQFAFNATSGGESFTTLAGAVLGNVTISTAAAGKASVADTIIPNYTQTTFHKQILTRGGFVDATIGRSADSVCANWANTAAVTSVTFAMSTADNFVVGSTFTIYGEP